jgi:thiol-disulfide isomerase/thioredoxin
MKFFLILLILTITTFIYANDLNPLTFDTEVLNSDKVWVVEFYSGMCGSCKEFSPVFQQLKSSMNNLHFGEINIDKTDGMKVAERVGALEEGIPNVRIFHQTSDGSKGTSIVKGNLIATLFYFLS